jgi:predicted RNA binding protein YcfA (HicA-like mRNA interferase family)
MQDSHQGEQRRVDFAVTPLAQRWERGMPSEVRFPELRKLLEQHGWTLDRIKGSHHVFVRKGGPIVVLPVHRGRCSWRYKKLVDEAIASLGKPTP